MKVLVACEFSGIVRDAFIARGHDAISCDKYPSERPGPHFQGDVLDLLYEDGAPIHHPFDLMIAHPPCTYLANSGVRWLYGGKGTERDEARWDKMLDGAQFFRHLLLADVPRIAVENPIMHRYGRATDIVEGRTPRVHYASPSPDRWAERSRTDPGIAAAMAEQWGAL